MSVSIMWRLQEPKKGIYFPEGGSTLLQWLRDNLSHGAEPIVLKPSDSAFLRGAGAAGLWGAKELADVLDQAGQVIEVWGEW